MTSDSHRRFADISAHNFELLCFALTFCLTFWPFRSEIERWILRHESHKTIVKCVSFKRRRWKRKTYFVSLRCISSCFVLCVGLLQSVQKSAVHFAVDKKKRKKNKNSLSSSRKWQMTLQKTWVSILTEMKLAYFVVVGDFYLICCATEMSTLLKPGEALLELFCHKHSATHAVCASEGEKERDNRCRRCAFFHCFFVLLLNHKIPVLERCRTHAIEWSNTKNN